MVRPRLRFLLALITWPLAGASAGCDRPPTDEAAREWTPVDHDHSDEKGKVLSGGSTSGSRARGAKGESDAANDDSLLVELTWQKQCASCHGPIGRGDGPNGPMVKAPDLTQPDWQEKVSDDAMATTILQGRGAMPKFDLPPEVVIGLVGRIRASKGR